MESLFGLNKGEKVKVIKIDLDRETKERLLALGLYVGCEVIFERSAPLKDPQEYLVNAQFISIRKELAKKIFIERLDK